VNTVLRRVPWRTAAAVALVAVGMALPLRELYRHQGPPMEEGFMLVFPEQVLRGALPNLDFLHLYGTGSLWVLAAVFKVFGTTLATERTAGLVQQLGIVFGVFALARPWGRRIAATCGLLAVVLVVPPVGLAALAWNGGVALGVIGLTVGLSARRAGQRGDDSIEATERTDATDATGAPETTEATERTDATESRRSGRRRLLIAGLLAGFALMFRPDLIIAISLGYGAMLWGLGGERIKRFALGLALGVSPYLIQFATAGLGNSIQGMLLDPVFALRGGRHLQIPPSWDRLDGALQKAGGLVNPPWPLSAPAAPHQVFFWFFCLPVAALFTVAVGWRGVRRDPGRWRSRVVLAAGLFGLGLLAQALQRPDTTHLAWVSCVPLAFLPVAIAEVLPGRVLRLGAGLGRFIPGVVVVVLIAALFPFFTLRTYTDYTRQALLDRGIARWSVSNNGRNFWLGEKSVADEAQAMVNDLDRMAKPGQKLLVGPTDLRKTNYSDAYLYYLLPKLDPATYYIEMDPGVANAPDSGLAGEVAKSDWIIRSNVWNQWPENNDSQKFGSPEPNRVLDRHFCQVRDYGKWFSLWRRCR